MTMSQQERAEVRKLQEAFLANGGVISHCPMHAQSTGQLRFNNARSRKRQQDQKPDFVFDLEGEDRTRFRFRVAGVRTIEEAERAVTAVYPDAKILGWSEITS